MIAYVIEDAMIISLLALIPVSGPLLSVDAAADHHPISPLIYGMAYADPALAKEIRLPLNRWGGDGTTRYNWQVDSTNAGDDWFFMAGGKDHPTPSGEPDAWVTTAKSIGGTVLLTIPFIDYVNKATTQDCTFPVSIFGPQQKTNPYVHPVVDGKVTDAGNGRTADGKPIVLTKSQILRVHTPNTPALQKAWVAHLVSKFGPAASGGVPIYELDNEPDGWNNTHRDIHPGNLGHDELVNKTESYGAAVKEADPTAAVLGPGGFLLHYQNEGAPGDGKAEHGGLGQASYFLQQMAAYEKAHGKRLLDYFDEHYYPVTQDGSNDEIVLESTRSLWDPSYVEKNWYGKYNGAINLIPSFRKWVQTYYPGTKLSISEYGWGDVKTPLGALVQTDILGIFAREGLGLACLFGPPKATEAGANAFRLFRNYDGKGSAFGENWVRSESAAQGAVAIYGAERKADGALTLVVVNKSKEPQSCRLALANFSPAPKAAVFRYDGGTGISALPDQTVTASGFFATYPPRSATMIVLARRG